MRCLVALGISLTIFSTSAIAELKPSDPSDVVKISRKIGCSLKDGEAITYHWTGNLYSRRQGERDKKLFMVEGMNVRACTAVSDPKRGNGYRLVSRELMLYKDPDSGAVLSTWDNPWSGETVDVIHVANDPVNFGDFEMGRDGKPATWTATVEGDMWRSTTTVPLWYPSPLASEYEAEVGGTYHATEMFNFFGSKRDLLSSRTNTAQVHVGWVRVSDWLPWMKMNGREGTIYVHTAGRKLDRWDDLSDTMKNEIREHYPDYVGPPPLDDDRRNETSWLYYKRLHDGERTAPVRE